MDTKSKPRPTITVSLQFSYEQYCRVLEVAIYCGLPVENLMQGAVEDHDWKLTQTQLDQARGIRFPKP